MNVMHPLPLAAVLVVSLSACAPPDEPAKLSVSLEEQESNTRSLLIGLSTVDENIVWASGTAGVVVRTVDGGANWTATVVPGADTVQFRDIHGVDAETAYVLSIGTGTASRIYKTIDGGSNWDLQFMNEGPGGFFDCMDFWDAESGFAFSDSFEGEFILIRTEDGGNTWSRVPADKVPEASKGEGSFAASGRCAMVIGDSTGFVGTGAGATARILKTTDRGLTWTDYETPIHDGTPGGGITSLSFVDEQVGFAFGGELGGRDSTIHNAIATTDGGLTWSVLTPPQLPDIYGGTHVPGHDPIALVVAGPKGIDYSNDGGRSWTSLSKLDHWGIAFANETTGWAVGPGGRITKLSVGGRRSVWN